MIPRLQESQTNGTAVLRVYIEGLPIFRQFQKFQHSSENHAILYMNRVEKVVYLLLVYHKPDLEDGDETTQWHTLIREHHKDLIEYFEL
jgi:hypothetical protein